MKILDLFSGRGGFSLGLERVGWKTVAFCEMDKHCQVI
jgi:DNA (cytosine-5)-methyltransferase 1